MKKIRTGVFETNSSSTHSITICDENDYVRWQNGELVYDDYAEKFIEISSLSPEIISSITENNYFGGYIDNHWVEYHTYKRYIEMSELESFDRSYTTKSGDKIVAFGRYGYDG